MKLVRLAVLTSFLLLPASTQANTGPAFFRAKVAHKTRLVDKVITKKQSSSGGVQTGHVVLGGRIIRDLASPAKKPLDEKGVGAFVGGFKTAPETLNTHDSHADVVTAAKTPPMKRADGSRIYYHDLVLVDGGLGGILNSRGQIAAIAKYAKKSMVVVYPHMEYDAKGRPTKESALRPLPKNDGKALPPELAGKVMVIGIEKPVLIDARQQADIKKRQIKILSESKEQLGVDILQEGFVNVAHSQGVKANGMVIAQLRNTYRDGSLPGIQKMKVFSLGGTLEGGVLADTIVAKSWRKFTKKVAGKDGDRAITGLEPKRTAQELAESGATKKMLDEIIPIRVAGVLSTGDGELQGTRPGFSDLNDLAVQFKGEAGRGDGPVSKRSALGGWKSGHPGAIEYSGVGHMELRERPSIADDLAVKADQLRISTR